MRINKDIEQALRSLSYIEKHKGLVNAREISTDLNIPFEKLSKVLQKLAAHGVVKAHRGRQGGYGLARELQSISLEELYTMLEENYYVVPCLSGRECKSHELCQILPGMNRFQIELNSLLKKFSLADFTASTTRV
ncbi:MAG: Rrf2 family transcriptional regulator [Spirochaetaceae bacterium]|jgi:Rrf2 family protein|nr:Rrf2 family transcriptional regulator [Spirochaetaceae bacterium]